MTSELIDGSVFFHIPKTGGTWIHEVLVEQGLIRRRAGRQKHAGFVEAVLYPGGKTRWKDRGRLENWSPRNFFRPGSRCHIPFTFCFVRHPVRWYESWWRFIKGMDECPWFQNSLNPKGLVKRWTPGHLLYQCFDRDFNTFVRNVYSRYPGFVTWLYGHFAAPEINFVGKQENLVDDLISVLTMRGLPFDEERIRAWPRANESKLAESAVAWEWSLLRQVQMAERAAILRFNYEPLRKSGDGRQLGCLVA